MKSLVEQVLASDHFERQALAEKGREGAPPTDAQRETLRKQHSGGRPLSSRRDAEVLKLYREWPNCAEVARKVGLSKSGVRHALLRMGVRVVRCVKHGRTQ